MLASTVGFESEEEPHSTRHPYSRLETAFGRDSRVITMPSNTIRHRPWIAVALVAALVVVPTVAMGFGMLGMGPAMGGHWGHGMWGASDGASAWMLVLGAGVQLLFLALLLGLGYLGYRALTSQAGSNDSALEELRIAYARGDVDAEEFDRRRKRLEPPQ